MATEVHLARLSNEKRQELESWLLDFDLSWDEHQLSSWVKKLPPKGDGLRRPALIELVKIDMDRRWQHGQKARLEAYVKAMPELGPTDTLPIDLVLAEYEARQESGATVELVEFEQRFPHQAETLHRLLGGLPEQFGRYRILDELGHGAMGAVYLAHDTELDRDIALKVPHFQPSDGPEIRQRFLSEARAAATIHHPNICPVFDVGEINGVPYLTMPYLEGRSLSEVVDEKPLRPRQAVALVFKLAVALQEAHESGIVHRDLKPSNIMINQRGEPVILDFGLARRLDRGDARLTRSGQPLGSPAYMSPEQVSGHGELMGPGCDVYSLGVILYQLLAGRLPFEGSIAEVLGQIVTRRPDPPSKYCGELDPELDRLCQKALEKKVARRYADMHEFAAALAQYVHSTNPVQPNGKGQAVSATRRTADKPRAKVSRSRSRFIVLACGLAAVLLAAAICWAAFSGKASKSGDASAAAPSSAGSSTSERESAQDSDKASSTSRVHDGDDDREHGKSSRSRRDDDDDRKVRGKGSGSRHHDDDDDDDDDRK